MGVEEIAGPSRWRFPPRPSCLGEARRAIGDCLERSGRGDLVDTAELLVSEIVTNALVHAGTDIEVACSLIDGGLRIEVTDGSPHVPVLRSYGPSAGTGRGLMLLDEMVDAWGVEPAGPGKTVWFTLACHGGEVASSAAHAPGGARPDVDAVPVHLLDVPLLLHEAWRQHADSLLREYLLASLDLGMDEEAIAVHAAASDAIALLAEHIPVSGAGEDAERVMMAATEPGVSCAHVQVPVPVISVPHFVTLDRALHAALAMVDNGAFLNPPTQPEMVALRSWICGEVRGQSQGREPTGWRAQDEPPRQVRPLHWDTRRVSDAETALVAADDADRIVAISRPALDILGYDDPAQLVGARLVSIIPERYRQAHLAGFTLHSLTGRAPLIGHSVVVPALRKDGSETPVRLTIGTERTGDGRTVFVAGLDGPA